MKWLPALKIPAPKIKGFPVLVVLVITGVINYLLFIFPSPLDFEDRLLVVVEVVAAGLLTYGLLAWLVPRHINRLAETTTPRELVAVTVLASAGQAWGVACLALMPAIHALSGVEFTAADYLTNGPVFALVAAAVTALYSLKLFIQRWKVLLVMEEELKGAVLKAEFESLKAQVNPHFLFNSLNILSALIPEDPDNAVAMVERMSKVFRYNLQNTDNATSRLGDELKIAESYLFIHQMRFGENLRCEIAVPPTEIEKQVVTQGLLTLVENALKHNECSREKPLYLRIAAAEGWLVVTNTLQIKNRLQTDSTGIGLKNLRHRYALLTNRVVVVEETEESFVVKLPLLAGIVNADHKQTKITTENMELFNNLFGEPKQENNELPKNLNFTSSEDLMDENQFWEIIQAAKDSSRGDYEQHYEEVAKQLHKLSPDEIILFANSFRFFREQANTWELWGAIYIIQGGCDNDSFIGFREWVIGQGKDFYFKTIKDPETLAELETEFIEETAEFEGLGDIPAKVFKKRTGQKMPNSFQENYVTTGKKWEEEGDELKTMFPKIYAKYPDNI